jgi:hypothetical protein
MKDFETYQLKMIDELKASISAVHFSFDLWTSPNHQGIVAVVAHFLNPSARNL